MSTAVDILVVFCEGPHDVAFVSKVMTHCLDFKKPKPAWVFSEYPSPLDKLFSSSVKRHAQKDLRLDMAHKFFLPDAVFERENHLILLFNSGGKTQADKVSTLLSELLDLLEDAESATYGENPRFVAKARYLFLYDADDWGLDTTCRKAREWFATVGERAWLDSDLQADADCQFAAVNGDKALYIWGETPNEGTLEDWLHPLFDKTSHELVEKATAALDDMFDWELVHSKRKQAIANAADRKKAILTVAGQKQKSGYSMNVIVGQTDMISSDDLKTDEKVKAFADFVARFASYES